MMDRIGLEVDPIPEPLPRCGVCGLPAVDIDRSCCVDCDVNRYAYAVSYAPQGSWEYARRLTEWWHRWAREEQAG